VNGPAPPVQRGRESPLSIDKQFIHGNSLIDAVILQLGLQGNY